MLSLLERSSYTAKVQRWNAREWLHTQCAEVRMTSKQHSESQASSARKARCALSRGRVVFLQLASLQTRWIQKGPHSTRGGLEEAEGAVFPRYLLMHSLLLWWKYVYDAMQGVQMKKACGPLVGRYVLYQPHPYYGHTHFYSSSWATFHWKSQLGRMHSRSKGWLLIHVYCGSLCWCLLESLTWSCAVRSWVALIQWRKVTQEK